MTPLLSKGLSRVFSSTTVQKHQFFSAQPFFVVQLSHLYMTTGKNTALTIWTFAGKVMSLLFNMLSRGFSGCSDGKETACNGGNPSSIPGSGRSPGGGNGYPFPYSCLENPMDRGAWQATAHGVAQSHTTEATQHTWVLWAFY